MGILQRIFSKNNDLPALRKAMKQQRYADALLIADELSATGLDPEQKSEVATLAAQAGDALARINLDEGLYLLRDKQWQQAVDHLQLAKDQAVSTELIQQINDALMQADNELPSDDVAASCGGCDGCTAPEKEDTPDADDDPLDFDSQLELILVSYPEELVQRYRDKSDAFLRAFVAGHQGEEVEALKQFGKLAASEQDDLFDFEVGSLMARLGEPEKGCDALYSALQQNPDLLIAAETLVAVLLAVKKHETAINFIKLMLDKQSDAAFCHAQLASIYHVMDNGEQALHHGLQAIEAGQTDSRIVLMTAMLLEGNNELERAEELYRRIPAAGGCCGSENGINLYLAEFLLRQKRELRPILDTFNDACRQEANNPRWQLRVAQTYLALGWEKRGKDLLRTVVRDPRLMEELRAEGEAMLAD